MRETEKTSKDLGDEATIDFHAKTHRVVVAGVRIPSGGGIRDRIGRSAEVTGGESGVKDLYPGGEGMFFCSTIFIG